MRYYAYHLIVQKDAFNALNRFGRLMQTFVVDMFLKVDKQRLDYLRRDQKTLRTKVVLPSTYTGEPRYMHERVQDAMSYVRMYSRPTLFLTMTCNPRWPEIENELLPSQSAHHRPDIVARVFDAAKNRFLQLLTKETIFDFERLFRGFLDDEISLLYVARSSSTFDRRRGPFWES